METLTVPAKLENLPQIMTFVKEISLANSANAEQLMAIELAVEEIVVNIMSYAYDDQTTGNVKVLCDFINEHLTIQIYDSGKKYNPLLKETPDICADIDDRPIGGLGIFLTKEMMDEVSYKYENGQNVLTLVKQLGKKAPEND